MNTDVREINNGDRAICVGPIGCRGVAIAQDLHTRHNIDGYETRRPITVCAGCLLFPNYCIQE